MAGWVSLEGACSFWRGGNEAPFALSLLLVLRQLLCYRLLSLCNTLSDGMAESEGAPLDDDVPLVHHWCQWKNMTADGLTANLCLTEHDLALLEAKNYPLQGRSSFFHTKGVIIKKQ